MQVIKVIVIKVIVIKVIDDNDLDETLDINDADALASTGHYC